MSDLVFLLFFTDEAVRLYIDALSNVEVLSTKAIKNYLTDNKEVMGYSGNYTINEHGGDSDREYILMKYEASKLVRVK